MDGAIAAVIPIEQPVEARGTIETWETEPIDRTSAGYQRAGSAVADQRVIVNGRIGNQRTASSRIGGRRSGRLIRPYGRRPWLFSDTSDRLFFRSNASTHVSTSNPSSCHQRQPPSNSMTGNPCAAN